MRALNNRLRRIEQKLIPPIDPRVSEIARILRERRRRRLEAEGKPFTEPERPPNPAPRRLNVAETLRWYRTQQHATQER